jgi:MFS family permease
MVCGFHVAFIATHMPGVIALCGLPPTVSGMSLSIIGLFNILGSLGVGWLAAKFRMKSLLSVIYALRAIAVLLFLLAPKNEATVLVFSAVMGLTYLSTVPPTAGLVTKFYGPQYMGTLFGLVMLSHQVSGFFGAYLGGKTFELTNSYNWMWYVDIVLAVGAALVLVPSLPGRSLGRSTRPLKLDEADWIALDDTLTDHPSVKWRRQRYPKLNARYRCNSILSVAGSVVWIGRGRRAAFSDEGPADIDIVEGPLQELETDFWVLAQPDIRHLQRVKLLFDFLKENATLRTGHPFRHFSSDPYDSNVFVRHLRFLAAIP